MNSVFILQHSYENGEQEETKFIGAYSNEQEAKNAISRLKDKPGFIDKQDCFFIDEYMIDKDHWTEGFYREKY